MEREDNIKPGYVSAPYVFKTVKTSVNNETVWHSNKFINFLLKIKRFFYKSKNYKNHNIYSKKTIKNSLYGTMSGKNFKMYDE